MNQHHGQGPWSHRAPTEKKKRDPGRAPLLRISGVAVVMLFIDVVRAPCGQRYPSIGAKLMSMAPFSMPLTVATRQGSAVLTSLFAICLHRAKVDGMYKESRKH